MPNAFAQRWEGYRAPTRPAERDPRAQEEAKRRADLYRTLGLAAPIVGTGAGALIGGGIGAMAGGVGAIPGAAAGAGIGGALGSGAGMLLGAEADKQVDPEAEADRKRQAQMQAFQMLMASGR